MEILQSCSYIRLQLSAVVPSKLKINKFKPWPDCVNSRVQNQTGIQFRASEFFLGYWTKSAPGAAFFWLVPYFEKDIIFQVLCSSNAEDYTGNTSVVAIIYWSNLLSDWDIQVIYYSRGGTILKGKSPWKYSAIEQQPSIAYLKPLYSEISIL